MFVGLTQEPQTNKSNVAVGWKFTLKNGTTIPLDQSLWAEVEPDDNGIGTKYKENGDQDYGVIELRNKIVILNDWKNKVQGRICQFGRFCFLIYEINI